MDKLEPCPCGSTDLREQSLEPTGQESDYAQIVCNDCGIRGPIADQVGNFRRPFDAWNAIWNTRTTPTVQEAAKVLKSAKSAFESGCEQGSDEATAYEWGSVPQQTRESAWSDFMAEWNPDSAALRAIVGDGK